MDFIAMLSGLVSFRIQNKHPVRNYWNKNQTFPVYRPSPRKIVKNLTWDIDIHRNYTITATHHWICIMVVTSTICTTSHWHHPFWLWHLQDNCFTTSVLSKTRILHSSLREGQLNWPGHILSSEQEPFCWWGSLQQWCSLPGGEMPETQCQIYPCHIGEQQYASSPLHSMQAQM